MQISRLRDQSIFTLLQQKVVEKVDTSHRIVVCQFPQLSIWNSVTLSIRCWKTKQSVSQTSTQSNRNDTYSIFSRLFWLFLSNSILYLSFITLNSSWPICPIFSHKNATIIIPHVLYHPVYKTDYQTLSPWCFTSCSTTGSRFSGPLFLSPLFFSVRPSTYMTTGPWRFKKYSYVSYRSAVRSLRHTARYDQPR